MFSMGENEVGAGLKLWLLVFALILIGALGYLVVSQKSEIKLIYDEVDQQAAAPGVDVVPQTH
ncbi:hypothetical protein A3A71_03975 [Candidatus Berkelbacteria bacterium RIFCSPLOWO2_01_FULL_50_28]|uniref:Uncharacterized protein n=1 Tax=Candidatus Berkelbacteria bacterium RIFCSPLOWO2_01_FULL_50_28 TaxID=1797471 RepID=A0A1F5EA84_9BACT|nr:MAG: hypothetical protein A3A71_03975 [Candidatus Berkelbacteria bacterium RIFCSPLOWO2_01_FULL_50_28]